jgi:MFS family permease
VLVYFSTTILKNVGLDAFYQQLLAAVMNTAFWLGTWPLYWTLERWGRRPILFWSTIVCTGAMAVFVAMNGVENKTSSTQWTAVAFVIIFVFVFGYGWIAIPWLVRISPGKMNDHMLTKMCSMVLRLLH